MAAAEPLTRKSGGGCLTLAGVPFALGGTFAMLDLLGHPSSLLPWNSGGPGALGGCAALIIGLFLILIRHGWTLDPRSRTFKEWWGLPRPVRKTERSWDDFQEVTLTFVTDFNASADEIGTSRDSYYIVALLDTAAASCKLDRYKQRPPALLLAKQVAGLMNLALRDSSRGATVLREAGHLEESLQARYARTGERPEVPGRLKSFRCQLESNRRELSLRLPAPLPFLESPVVAALLGLTFALFLFYHASGVVSWTQGWLGYLGGGVIHVFWAVAALALLWTARCLWRNNLTSARLTISPSTLEVRAARGAGKMALSQVQEVELQGKAIPTPLTWLGDDCVEARGDLLAVQFGYCLSQAELEWIRAVIHDYLARLPVAPQPEGDRPSG